MAIIARARAMRKALTPAGTRLWLALRQLRAGDLHFRRQHPERGYYLDFVCLDRRVIVEVDGSSHEQDDRGRRDRVRDAVLAREGFLTLRYDNAAVLAETAGVVRDFVMRCRARPTRLSLRASPADRTYTIDHAPPEGEGFS